MPTEARKGSNSRPIPTMTFLSKVRVGDGFMVAPTCPGGWSGQDAGCAREKAVTKSSASSTVSRLFVLELNAGCIHLMNADGSDRTTIVTGCHLPDGIVVDLEAGH